MDSPSPELTPPSRYRQIPPRQADCLDAYIAYVIAHGMNPDAKQLAAIIGVDRSRIYRIWAALWRRGYVLHRGYPSRPIRTKEGIPFHFGIILKKVD